MLQEFGEEIWTADGATVSIAGFDFPTRMIVIRLSAGDLFLWSPVTFSRDLQIAVDQLGPVRHLVAPNHLHHLFLADWQRAYPEAKLHAAPGLRDKRADLPWHGDLDDGPARAWSDDIDQVVVRGNWITTEVLFFHRRSRTAIFTDLIQQFEPGWFKGWRAFAARLDLMTASRPTVLRKFRAAFWNRRIAREALRRILAWPTEALLAAHAPPVKKDGRAAIMHAFGWLLR